MDLWMTVIEGVGIFIAIWICSRLINEGITDCFSWLFQPIFFMGLLLMWITPIDWSIPNWAVILMAFSLNLIGNICNHFRFTWLIQEPIKQQSWWQIGPLRQYRVKNGYVQDSGMEDNTCTSRFGTPVLGISSNSSVWDKLFGGDRWTDSQRKALLRHEYGHNIVAVPIIFLETLVFYWFCNSVSVWNILVLIPKFISVWTLVNWLDELLADTVAGHHGFSFFGSIFKNSPFSDYFLGGIGAYSHPPILLRCLAYGYAIPIGVVILVALSLFASPSISSIMSSKLLGI